MTLIILVVDDEADVETLFREQFRRELRAGHFTMEFAQSASNALRRISEAPCPERKLPAPAFP